MSFTALEGRELRLASARRATARWRSPSLARCDFAVARFARLRRGLRRGSLALAYGGVSGALSPGRLHARDVQVDATIDGHAMSPQRGRERLAAVGAVRQFDPLLVGHEHDGVIADDRAATQGVDADLAARPFAGHAFASVARDLFEIDAAPCGQRLGQPERGAAAVAERATAGGV